jgi:two-component system, chemotaxis family, chemotaxis protein CheY
MHKILVAEDSLFMQNRVSKMLLDDGYEVIHVANGLEAIEAYQNEKPDLVLMDINMPLKDGLEALEEIRRIDPQARVVMLTALNQQAAVLQAVHMGARDFLTKPVAPAQLLRVVEQALKF